MAYTSKGNQLKSKLDSGVNKDTMLDLFRPLVKKSTADVIKRIRDTGSGANGSFSTPYSDRWARKRRKAGKGTSKKDFTFNGDMLDSVGIVDEDVTAIGLSYKVSPSGSNVDRSKDNYMIAKHHSEYEAQNIIEMTQEEVNEFVKDATELMKNYLGAIFR